MLTCRRRQLALLFCRSEACAGQEVAYCALVAFLLRQLCAGPMPLFNDPGHKGMIDHLQSLVASLQEPPKALVSDSQKTAFQLFGVQTLDPALFKPGSSALQVVVSAHWETAVPTVTSGQRPRLIYDYYNFPKEAYEVCLRSSSLWR